MWHLPGIVDFIGRIEADLDSGSCTVVRCPPHCPQGLVDAVIRQLQRGRRDYRCVDLREHAIEGNDHFELLDGLGRSLGSSIADRTDVREFARNAEDHIFLLVVDREDAWQAWSTLIELFRRANHELPENERGMICAFVPSHFPTPSFDVGLTIQKWEGVVREIDVRHWVDELMLSRDCSNLIARRLHSELLVELAATDLSLVNFLVDRPLASLIEPTEALTEYANELSWLKCNDPNWESGVVDVRNGEKLFHSAFIAWSNKTADLQRRVWNAQLVTLFPYLERRRHQLLPKFRPFLDLPYVSVTGERKEQPEDLEIGEILFCLRNKRIPPQVIRELRNLREVRNELAHMRPASFKVIADAIDLLPYAI